jgi:hypothetical protein
MEKYPRTCSVTGEGMYEGYVFLDGDAYAKKKEDAILLAHNYGYDSLADAYDYGAVYWTQWEDDDIDEDE